MLSYEELLERFESQIDEFKHSNRREEALWLAVVHRALADLRDPEHYEDAMQFFIYWRGSLRRIALNMGWGEEFAEEIYSWVMESNEGNYD